MLSEESHRLHKRVIFYSFRVDRDVVFADNIP